MDENCYINTQLLQYYGYYRTRFFDRFLDKNNEIPTFLYTPDVGLITLDDLIDKVYGKFYNTIRIITDNTNRCDEKFIENDLINLFPLFTKKSSMVDNSWGKDIINEYIFEIWSNPPYQQVLSPFVAQ